MTQQSTMDFTYDMVEQLFQEARYDRAIALLSNRVEARPGDRQARLMLLLANLLEIGAAGFYAEIEQLQSIVDLSSDERQTVLRIYFAVYHYAERMGQTDRQSAYLNQIRQFTLQQPVSAAFFEARAVERSIHETAETSPWRSWYPLGSSMTAGATAMVITVLLGLYVTSGRPLPQRQDSETPLVRASASAPLASYEPATAPAVALLPALADGAVRQRLTAQLDSLNQSYAQWAQSSPAMSGTVTLKLTVEPSGQVIKVDEVVSRLSEHRYLDAVIAAASRWQLPHDKQETVEITVPLMFMPGAAAPTTVTAQAETGRPATLRQTRVSPHTRYALEPTESPTLADKAATGKLILAAHTRGRLESAGEADLSSSVAMRDGDAAKLALAMAFAQEQETATGRTVPLKYEPRFAAAAVEKVGLGARVMVLRNDRDWIKVKVNASGNVGYIRKEFLTAAVTTR